jgi:hypothetical protein
MQRNWIAFVLAVTVGCSGAVDAEETDQASTTASAFVRIVDLVSDAPAFDVCLRAHSSDAAAPFEVGPLLASHGAPGGLSYPGASAHLAVSPGTYDVRIVPARAPDCAASLDGIPDSAQAGKIEAGRYASLVAVGSLAKSFFAIDAVSDEPAPSPGRAKLRFLHDTVAAPALDVGLGTGAAFVPLFTEVSFRSIGSGDASGFRDVEPSADSTLVLRLAGRALDTLSVPDFVLAEGTVTTVFSIGVAGTGGKLLGSMLRCSDDDAPGAAMSTCRVVP